LDKINLKVSESYNSSFINSVEKSIRDENSFSLSSAYKINDKFKFGLSTHNNILSDSRKIEINSASISNVVLFSELNPENKIYLTPFAGYMNNRQIGESDYGYLYGTEAALNNFELSDFNVYSQLKFRNEDISPRKNELRYFDLQTFNNFSPGITNQFNAQYSLNRKDFYFQADSLTAKSFNIINNIQSRIESNYLIQDTLQHSNFLNAFALDLVGRISLRNIDRDTRYRLTRSVNSSIFDTKISELKLEFESLASYYSSFFNGSIKLLFSQRDEQNITKRFDGVSDVFFEERSRLESSKNNNSTRALLSFWGNMNISKTDKFYFSFFQNKLKYDTPSEENFDDRDEILSILRLRYSKLLTSFFEAFINIEGTVNHTVYLFAEKSSNNNINRILKLSSGGNYLGKNFVSFNSFEVAANYTVYDFEDLNPNFRSYSFRQFTAIDSSTIKFTRKFFLNFYGYVKLSEQGNLRWKSFSTRPNRFLQEIYSEPKFGIQINEVLFYVGARYFSINTYNYNLKTKILDSEYMSMGPVAQINFVLRDSLYFKFYGWYEFIQAANNLRREQANFNLEMNYDF
ncbi:MAG: hypothetical protein ABI550_09875, partial [Ignavibacteriaceae bacterium]